MSGSAVAGALLLLLAADAEEKPRVSALEVTLDGRQVAVAFQLRGAFDDDFRERLASGLPSGFAYEIGLYSDRKRWWDRELQRASLQVVALYNAVTREYVINYKQDGELVETRVVRDLAELERAMTRFEALPALTIAEGAGRRRLLVKARALLGTRLTLGFVPVRDATPWVESAKFRAPEDLP